jgi:hypothetical protein
MVNLDVFRRLGLDDGDARAHDACITNGSSRFHTVSLRLVAAGNATARFRHHRRDADRPTAQGGIKQLLDAGKEAIAVDKQSGKRVIRNTVQMNNLRGFLKRTCKQQAGQFRCCWQHLEKSSLAEEGGGKVTGDHMESRLKTKAAARS